MSENETPKRLTEQETLGDVLVETEEQVKPARAAAPNPKKAMRRKAISVIVLLLGVALVVYPVVATIKNNEAHQKIVNETAKRAQNLEPYVLEKEIAAAEKYNTTLGDGPVLDPFLQRVVPNSPEYREYRKLLDFDGVIGSVHIPKINVKLPIYHGTDDATLDKGVGHLFGSALPVGGTSTKAVLTAHSGLGNATMFDELPNLGKGDEVFVQVSGKTLKYQVIRTEVVKPEQTDGLQLEPGKDLLVLVTCTPYAINTHRLLVTAERVPYNPEVDAAKLDVQPTPWRIWMAASLGIVFAALCIYLWMVFRKKKPAEEETDALNSETDVQAPTPSGEGDINPS